MKHEIRILIASAFVSFSVQTVHSADRAIDCNKFLPKASLLEKADQVDLSPAELQPSSEETKETNFKFNKQQQEMADLWDATVARSQDIQFVIQKLVPNNNDDGKTARIVKRMISNAVLGGMGTGMMMVPNMGAQIPNKGMQTSMNYLALTDANLEPSYPVERGQTAPYLLPAMANEQTLGIRKKSRLNETEQIMLYNLVRQTADSLVSNYRDYSEAMNDLAGGQDADDAVRMKHALICRSSLVGLAGEEAVTRLDESNGFTKLIKQFKVRSH